MGGIKTVLKWAVLSRILLFCLAYVFSVFPDFDTSQENLLNRAEVLPLFVSSHTKKSSLSLSLSLSLSFFFSLINLVLFLLFHRKPADAMVNRLLGHFERWDGVYFAMIAKEGYKYEQFHAFFPLYPMIISFLATGLFLFFSQESLLLYICMHVFSI